MYAIVRGDSQVFDVLSAQVWSLEAMPPGTSLGGMTEEDLDRIEAECEEHDPDYAVPCSAAKLKLLVNLARRGNHAEPLVCQLKPGGRG